MKKAIKASIRNGLSLFLTTSSVVAIAKPQEIKKDELNKSTYVLVHSAFTGPWAMESVAQNLRKKGFNVIIPELPAHGNNTTPAKDVHFSDYVIKIINELDKQNGKVILLGHSFAGTIISEVAEQRPEKVKSLVYLAGALIPTGTSFMDNLKDVKSILTENLVIDKEKGFVTIGNDKTYEAYVEDIPLDVFKGAEKYVVPEPLAPLSYKINLTNENFGKIPRYYIQALKDKAIPQSLQRKMYTETPVKQVFTIDSSHAPNLSNPTKVADILVMIQKIENNKLTNKVKQKVTKEINLITSKWEKDFSLEAKNKKAKKIVDVYAENALLQAMPASFGTFQGKNNIRKFWQSALDGGASDMIYHSKNILVLDDKTALLSATWSMNLFQGIITLEKWVKINHKWNLVEDNFEITKFLTPEAK
jgi:pimeloyl-ACP methyl ester carboxylesterase/ketosteroid isomerase-like protein